MNDEYVDTHKRTSDRITIGFVIVALVLMILGVNAWSNLNKLSMSIERHAPLGQILITLDMARLYELSYSRELTPEASSEALRFMNDALSVVDMMHSTESFHDHELNNIQSELQLYRSDFVDYVSLIEQQTSAKKQMIAYAQKSTELFDKLRQLQTQYIDTQTQLIDQKYRSIIDSTNAVSFSNNIYSSAMLLDKEHSNITHHEKSLWQEGEIQVVENMYSYLLAMVAVIKTDTVRRDIFQLHTLVDKYYFQLENHTGTGDDLKEDRFIKHKVLAEEILRLSDAIKKELAAINQATLRKLSEARRLLSDRVEISEMVILLADRVNIARQADRDFSLSGDNSLRDSYSTLVMEELSNVDKGMDNLKALVVTNDEKNLISELQLAVAKYKKQFTEVFRLSQEVLIKSNRMASSALAVDSLLSTMRETRAQAIREARELFRFMSIGGGIFLFVLIILGYLVRKSSSKLQTLTESLRRTNDRIKKTAEAKSRFLAMISHEIRTPMNAIIGMSYLTLEEGKLSKKEHGYIEKVHHSANLLLGILNDVLDISKIEAGKLTIESIEFSLYKTVDGVASIIYERARDKNLSIDINITERVPKVLIGDPLRIHQVLVNLSTNAVKFTESGVVSIDIDIDIEESSGDRVFLKMSVTDQGIGMSTEQITNLYTSFSQADSTTTRKYGGTGLGLAITKNLVELMNGTISVTSELGVGSEFIVVLPLEVGHSDEIDPSTYKKCVVLSDGLLPIGELTAEIRKRGTFIIESVNDYRRTSDYSALVNIEPILFIFVVSSLDKGFIFSLKKCLNQLANVRSSVVVLLKEMNDLDLFLDVNHDGESFQYNDTAFNKGNLNSLLDSQYNNHRFNIFHFDKVKFESDSIMGSRILVVDDNAINRELVTEILSKRGAESVVATNGRDAIDILHYDINFDVILMDCQMPMLDGYEATNIIKHDMAIDIPILALTANVLHPDRVKAKTSGMDGFIKKPIIVEEMIGTLNDWIEISRFECVLDKDAITAEETFGEYSEFEFLQVEGINLEKGLSVVGNNSELFMRLLSNFSKQYEHKEIVTDDSEKLKIDVHTLKGVAGNLGFCSIYQICTNIERNMPNTNSYHIDSLRAELARTCELINSQNKDKSAGCYIDFSDKEILEIIDQARHHNVEAIVALNSALGDAILAKLSADISSELKIAVKAYDFAKIEQILCARFR